MEEQNNAQQAQPTVAPVRQADPADVEKTMAAIRETGDTPYVIGSIEEGEKGVTLC